MGVAVGPGGIETNNVRVSVESEGDSRLNSGHIPSLFSPSVVFYKYREIKGCLCPFLWRRKYPTKMINYIYVTI